MGLAVSPLVSVRFFLKISKYPERELKWERWKEGLMRKTDGYPIRDATHIALETTRQFLEQDDTVRRLDPTDPTRLTD